MDGYFAPHTETQTPEKGPHCIEYPGLVDTVQLSAARLLDLPGALSADTFSALIANESHEARERITREVGMQFDDALLSFVSAALIAHRNQGIVILAEDSEGVNGQFPWEPKLRDHLTALEHTTGISADRVRIERYALPTEVDVRIDMLTEQAKALAA